LKDLTSYNDKICSLHLHTDTIKSHPQVKRASLKIHLPLALNNNLQAVRIISSHRCRHTFKGLLRRDNLAI
jgi:hypothetical protein